MKKNIYGLVLAFGLAAASSLEGATATQVVDLNIQPTGEGPQVGGLLAPLDPEGRRAVFGFGGGEVPLGLGVTDGTPGGTAVLADLCPGSCLLPSVSLFGRAGSRVLVRTSTKFDTQPEELWATDGSPDGTFRLRASGGEELIPCSESSSNLSANRGGALHFSARTPASGCDLWSTDGTSAGTRRVEDFADGEPLLAAGPMVRRGNVLFFTVLSPNRPSASAGLWRSSGTAESTLLVRSFQQASGLTLVGEQLFFVASAPEGDQLWTSDGTAVGTRQVGSFPPGTRLTSQPLQNLGAQVWFAANLPGNSEQIWQSDGTAAGTRRLVTLETPLSHVGLQLDFLPLIGPLVGNRLFVAPGLGKERTLWTSDGTPTNTRPIFCGLPGGCPQVERPLFSAPLAGLGGPFGFSRVVFGASQAAGELDLWATDGTPTGTRRLQKVCTGTCQIRGLASLGGLAWASVSSSQGASLWRTDGTPAGTVEVTPLGFTSFLDFQIARLADGSVLFSGSADGSSGLWKSDGTRAGTRPVAQLGAATASSGPAGLFPFGDELLFTAFSGTVPPSGLNELWRTRGTAASTAPLTRPAGVRGGLTLGVLGSVAIVLSAPGDDPQLWRTDGTPPGTFALPASFQGLLTSAVWKGDRLAFLISPDGERHELWETDGTGNGTRRIAELPEDASSAFALTAVGDRLYFFIAQAQKFRLWVSDGTAAGTRQLLSEAFSFPNLDIARLGSTTYFFVGNTLWRSDGTPGGSQPLFEVERAEFSGVPFVLTAFQGGLYYYTAGELDENNAFDVTLFRSDGTAAGTVQLVKQRVSSFGVSRFTPLGDRLFFSFADPEHGTELWQTDGTAAGTRRVSDIFPGPGSSFPQSLTAAGGRLFFAALDGEHGSELWESDGTAAGTRLVQDINPGFAYAFPNQLTVVGDRLFFSASDGFTGTELWVYPFGEARGCVPGPETLCLAGGRFAVQARWRDFASHTSTGQARPLTADTGAFWFFDAANLEVVLKMVDGRGLNDHHWTFTGALSNVQYALTVTDTQTGAARRYVNPSGNLGSLADTQAFGPLGAHLLGEVEEVRVPASSSLLPRVFKGLASPCAPSSNRLCLAGGRFGVEVRWRDFQGNTGQGTALPLSGDTGAFWFFAPENLELLAKVIDGRGLNGKFWVFFGALSNVEYTLRVTDGETGQVKIYTNPAGRLTSTADTAAF